MRNLHRRTGVFAMISALSVLGGCADLNGTTADETTDEARASVTLTFARDFSERASGPLSQGQRVRIAYDANRLTDCRGEQAGRPQWAITAFVRVGDGDVQTFAIAGLNAPRTQPTFVADRAGELQVWFQNTNRWGCVAWDSDHGNNYRFTVAAPPDAPGWIGNGAWVIARETCNGPCDSSRRALTETFDYETWARQRAAYRAIYFDVWKQGVTDRDNPDLWRQLDVQLLWRPVGTTQSWRTRYAQFDRRDGNNARYTVLLRELDPIGENTITRREDCPNVPLTVSADGMYVSTELEYYIRVNGVEYRPASGATFRGRFTQYRGLLQVCLTP